MFIGRREDGSIYGAWTSIQPDDDDHKGIEEVKDDHPDLVAFNGRTPENVATLDDVIAVLPADVRAALDARIAGK